MRKLLDTARLFAHGGSAPLHVGLAVLLGLLAAAATGANALLAVVLLAALLLNVRTRTFLATWATGGAAALLAGPQSAQAGHWLLERTPLGDWLAPWSESLAVALFDLDRFALVGGVAAALAAGVPLACLAGAIVRVAERRLAIERAAGAKGAKRPGRLLRSLHWMVAGRTTAPARASTRLARPLGFAVAAGIVVPLAGLSWQLGPELFEHALLDRLSRVNGAEVTAADVRLSLSDGLLEIDDLRIADPDHLDRDRWRAGYVTALVRLGPLARGRLVIDKLLIEEAACDAARDRRARRCELDFEAGPAAATTTTRESSPAPSGSPVEAYVRGWGQLESSLARFHDLLSLLERVAVAEDGTPAAGSPRCDFGRARPTLWIHEARVKGLPPEWQLGADATLEVTDLATDARAAGRTPRVEIAAPACGLALSAELHRAGGRARRKIDFAARGLDLAALFNAQEAAGRATLYAGTADLAAAGWADDRRVELPVRIALGDLDVELSEDRPAAGIAADVWNDGLYQMAALTMETLLTSDWRSARLTLDEPRLVASYRAQLAAAGDAEMVACIDRQLAANVPAESPAAAPAIETAPEVAASPKPAESRGSPGEATADPAATAESAVDSAVAVQDAAPTASALQRLGDAFGANRQRAAAPAAAEVAAGDAAPQASQPEQREPTAPSDSRSSAGATARGQLRYPRGIAAAEPVRVPADAPRAPRPADVARVAHLAPASAREAEPTEDSGPRAAVKQDRVDDLVASVEERSRPRTAAQADAVGRTPAPTEATAEQARAAIDTARLPAPIGLELGFDAESVHGATALSPPRGEVRTLAPPQQSPAAHPRPMLVPSADEPIEIAVDEPGGTERPTRLQRWSGQLTGGVRRLLPDFGGDDDRPPQTAAAEPGGDGNARSRSDGVVPRDPAMARRMARREAPPRRSQRATPPAGTMEVETGEPLEDAAWYRFWR